MRSDVALLYGTERPQFRFGVNQPPFDPNAPTQAIPIVTPPASPLPAAPSGGGPPSARGPYVHRFGNVPAYLIARFAAFATDVVAVGFLFAAFGFDALDHGTLAFASRDENGYFTLAAASLGAAIAVAFLCEALFGTTLGKLIFGLHVRRSDGGFAGVGRAFVRALVRPLDLFAVGPLLALATPRHQRLGDLVAGTVVSRSSLGVFAPLLGFALAALLAYAEIRLGGGLDSAMGVTAETASFAPDAYARVASLFGVVIPHGAPVAPALPFASPSPTSSAPAMNSAEGTATPEPVASDGVQYH